MGAEAGGVNADAEDTLLGLRNALTVGRLTGAETEVTDGLSSEGAGEVGSGEGWAVEGGAAVGGGGDVASAAGPEKEEEEAEEVREIT